MIDQHDVEMMIRAVIDSEDTIADSIDDAIDVRLAELDIDNVIEEMIQSVLDDQDEPIADLVEEKVNILMKDKKVPNKEDKFSDGIDKYTFYNMTCKTLKKNKT